MGSIKLGNSSVNSIYLGQTEVKKVYLGGTLIWSKEVTPVSDSISVSTYTSNRTKAAGSFPVTVTSSGAWSASVTSGSDWTKINNSTSASGNNGDSVTISYTANSTPVQKSATIHFVCGTAECNMNLTQEAAAVIFTVNTSSCVFDYDGTVHSGSTNTVSVTSNIPNYTLYCKDNKSWITWTSSTRTLSVDPYNNYDKNRSDNVTIYTTYNGTEYSGTVSVYQYKRPDASTFYITDPAGAAIPNDTFSVNYQGNESNVWSIKGTCTSKAGISEQWSISQPAGNEIQGLWYKKASGGSWTQATLGSIPSGTMVYIKVLPTEYYINKTGHTWSSDLEMHSDSGKSYTLHLKQTGAPAKLNTGNPSNPTYQVDSTGTFTLVTNPDMTWAVTKGTDANNAINRITTSSGTGDGTVSVKFNENTTFSVKQATVTVGLTATDATSTTKSVTFTQAAKPRELLVSTTSLDNFAYNATAAKTVKVTSNDSWAYTISYPSGSDTNWISVSNATGVTGECTCSVTVPSNYLGLSSRSGTIRFYQTADPNNTYKDVTVTQNEAPLTLYVSDTSAINAGTTGTSKNINITSNTSWTVTKPDWVTVSTVSGSGNYTNFTITVPKTTQPGQSTGGSVVFKATGCSDVTIPVTRSETAYNITINTANPTFDCLDHINQTFTITCNDGNNWQINTDSQYTSSELGAQKVNTTTVRYSVPENENEAKTYYIRVECTRDTSKYATFIINQAAGYSLTVSPTSVSVSASLNSYNNIDVSANNSQTISAAAYNTSWITNVSVSGDKVNYTCETNNTVDTRTGYIKVESKTGSTINKTVIVSIIQDEGIPTISLSESELSYSTSGGDAYLTVTSNDSWFTSNNGNTWITITPSSGTGDTTGIKVTTTSSSSARNGSITFSTSHSPQATASCTIKQIVPQPTIRFEIDSPTANNTGRGVSGSFTINAVGTSTSSYNVYYAIYSASYDGDDSSTTPIASGTMSGVSISSPQEVTFNKRVAPVPDYVRICIIYNNVIKAEAYPRVQLED